MAERTGSRMSDDFWATTPTECQTSHNNFGGLSIWCDEANIQRLLCKVRVGDRLEFYGGLSQCEHWGIYVGKLNFSSRRVVHFIPGNRLGRAFLDVNLPAFNVLLVNSIYTFVKRSDVRVRINNSKDEDLSPVDTRLICNEIAFQLKEVHKKCPIRVVSVYVCNVPCNDSEDFVNFCRYDRDHQHYTRDLNVKKVSDWYLKTNIDVFISEVRVGDRLEFRQRWGLYLDEWGNDRQQVVYFDPATPSSTDERVLCVESIGTILEYDKVRINNERDKLWPPLARTYILDEINRQLPGAADRCACKISFTDSKHFVNYFRYDYWRINFGLVSDNWYTSQSSSPRLRVGDRLEFHRTAPYSHWGIYVGEWNNEFSDQVAHFIGTGKMLLKGQTPGSSRSSAEVPKFCVESFSDVLDNGKFKIHNQRDVDWPPLDRTGISKEIQRHLERQSQNHPPTYSVTKFNCEHFVNHCRHCHHYSDQLAILEPLINQAETVPKCCSHLRRHAGP